MAEYKLHALASADVKNDRSAITLKLETDNGPVNISMTPAQLDHFVTAMEGIEQHLTMLDPVAGPAKGEAVQMRFYVVDGSNVGNAVVNNSPCVFVVLKAGNSTRAYAFDREKAESLARMVRDELPSLDRLTKSPEH